MPSDIYYSEPISTGFYRDSLNERDPWEALSQCTACTESYLFEGSRTDTQTYVHAKATSSSFGQTTHSITFCFPELHSIHTYTYTLNTCISRYSIVFIFLQMKYGYMHTYMFIQSHSVSNHATKNYLFNNTDSTYDLVRFSFLARYIVEFWNWKNKFLYKRNYHKNICKIERLNLQRYTNKIVKLNEWKKEKISYLNFFHFRVSRYRLY